MSSYAQTSDYPKLVYDPQSIHTHLVNEGQCDCGACVPAFAELSTLKSFSKIVSYKFPDNSVVIPVTQNEYAVFNPNANVAVLNQAAFEIATIFQQPRPFSDIPRVWLHRWGRDSVEPLLIELAKQHLIIPKECMASWSPDKHTLTAWLHITDQCNMRCVYCYLPHERTDMSDKNAKSAIEATFRSALNQNFRQVKFKYAGGEPLLRFPFIVNQHMYAQQLASKYALKLDGVILTNATLLTSEMIETIRKLNLQLMISLDGLGCFHDAQRAYTDNTPSSRQVTNSIDLALKHGITPNISITVSGVNIDGLPALIDWVLERDLPFSINFYRQNKLTIEHDVLQLETDRIVTGILRAYKVIESHLPRQNLLNSLVDRANLSIPHLRPCGVGDHYLVFNTAGEVAKCQMQMDNVVTDMHVNDPLLMLQMDKVGLQNPSVEDKLECKNCQWKYWCAGGCPLSAYDTTGYYDAKSPNCHIYQALYPEVIRLEGLRLLKHFHNATQM